MDIRDVKKNLGRMVHHDGRQWLFAGCILRRHRKTGRFYYEAELHDPQREQWVVVCAMEDVKEEVTT